MSRMQLGWLGGALLLTASFATTQLTTRADDPAKPNTVESKPLLIPAMSSPQTWPPGKVIFEQSETEKKIRAVLQQPAEFEFKNTPLGDVVEFIRKQYGITVQLYSEALAADGRGVETKITKSIRNTTLGNALRLLLDEHELTTVVKNDVLLLTTKSSASQPENLSVRTYQVHDLVVAPNDPTASQPDFDSIIDLLTCSVRPSDWSDNGGTIGFLRSYTGPGMLVLVATHDEEGHREIEQLLKSLRAARLQPIYDAQAQQPLPPPQAANIGGGGMVGGKTIPPTASATPDNAAPTTSQQRGGGMF